MNGGKMRGGPAAATRWLPAAAAGLVLVLLVAMLFRFPAPVSPAASARPEPVLRLRGSEPDPLFSENAALNDPTPLFLPTRWSSAQRGVLRRLPEGTFPDYGAKLSFSETGLSLSLPPRDSMPRRPVDALDSSQPGNPLAGIGRTDRRVQTLAARLAHVSVVAASTGTPVLERTLSEKDVPDAPAELLGRAWRPLEFMAAVDPAGLVGPLVPTVRSGTAADGFFLDYLAKVMRIGERLPPGFYRISVGP